MSAETSPFLLLVGILVIGGAGSLLPFSPVEPLVVTLALVAPALALPGAGLATVSQMGMKVILFLGTQRAEARLPERTRAIVGRVREKLAGRRWLQIATVLVSAALGVPPLYVVTLVCGALGLPLRDYLIAGTAGRGLRFTALALAPRLFLPAPLVAVQ